MIHWYVYNEYGKCSKISNIFLFLLPNKMLVTRGWNLQNACYVWIANREDPDQAATSEAVWSGSALFV